MPLTQRVALDGTVQLWWRMATSATEVWRHLTTAQHLEAWLGRPLTGQLRIGGVIDIDHGDGYRCVSTVSALEPGVRLAGTWRFPDEPPSAVTVDLAADELTGGCTLHLTHVDLGDLVDAYAIGWVAHLTFLEASAAGTPLPRTTFWSLHETLSRLLQEG